MGPGSYSLPIDGNFVVINATSGDITIGHDIVNLDGSTGDFTTQGSGNFHSTISLTSALQVRSNSSGISKAGISVSELSSIFAMSSENTSMAIECETLYSRFILFSGNGNKYALTAYNGLLLVESQAHVQIDSKVTNTTCHFFAGYNEFLKLYQCL